MEVRAQVADQGVVVVEIRLIFGVNELVLVGLHQWIQQGDLLQEVTDLLLVALELAKLLV